MQSFEIRHLVCFEETNLVGNVYFANHVRWQGRCREMFLREHAPEILAELAADLLLVTTRCGCEYLAELRAFDEIIIRMRLATLGRNRVGMEFTYWRVSEGGEELVARGDHEIAVMRMQDGHPIAAPIPASLARALARFGG